MDTTTIQDIKQMLPHITEDVNKEVEVFITQGMKEFCRWSKKVVYAEPNITEHSEQDKFHKLEESCKNTELDQELQREMIDELNKVKRRLKKEIASYEVQVKSVNSKKGKLSKKILALEEKRDQVQICKRLTNTDFTYQSSDIRGYTFCPQSRIIKHFNISPDNNSQEQITNVLYDVLKTVCTQDISVPEEDK